MGSARDLARIAARVGAGPLELTNRANLQLRAVPVEAIGAVRAAMVRYVVPAGDNRVATIYLDPESGAIVRILARGFEAPGGVASMQCWLAKE